MTTPVRDLTAASAAVPCHPAWALGARLDAALGDPADPAALTGYRESVHADHAEEFPAGLCSALDRWGLAGYYVPAEHGGELGSFDQLQQLIRTVARRDLTAAIGHGKTFLGTVAVWVGAEPQLARRVGTLVRSGELVSLGLTERAHGSDLMAGEVVALPAAGGYRLTGEKWLINNATRGRLLCLLACTAPEAGPRGFTVLLVDKERLPGASYRCLPKVPTLGIRGADISGIVYQDAPVGADAVVGTEGGGTELVLKALQISRTLCPSLSLGAMDAALRLLVRFTRERELYGRPLADLPLTRRILADAYADLLLAEAVSSVATRSIHVLPQELSVAAAAAKYLVPTVGDEVIGTLGQLLGARSVLADEYADGLFQKIARDHRIVGIFDGNTLVNLYSLIAQFRTLARAYARGGPASPSGQGLTVLFDLAAELPPFEPERLSLVSRRGSSVVAALPDLVAALRDEVGDRAGPDDSLHGALAAAERLLVAATVLHHGLGDRTESVTGTSPESFEQARAWTLCFAGACCLGIWLAGRRSPGRDRAVEGPWRDGRWLRAVLDRSLARMPGAPRREPGPAPSEGLLDALSHQYEQGLLFSLLHCPIAEGPPPC